MDLHAAMDAAMSAERREETRMYTNLTATEVRRRARRAGLTATEITIRARADGGAQVGAVSTTALDFVRALPRVDERGFPVVEQE